jgi:hypothetical protein
LQSDSSGKACCGQVWNTVPRDQWWILGVFRNGTQLNPVDENVSDPVSGSATYDLYACDSGFFRTGQSFVIAVSLAAARVNTTAVDTLWGKGPGQFRTKGRYAAATVRGTWWLTQDRCDGTLVRVRQGIVEVRDLVRKRTVLVRTGKSYLARKR